MNFATRKNIFSLVLLTAFLSVFASSAQAAAFQSSDKWAIWNNGGYWVQNDVWGANPGPQTIYANSFSNWWVICNHSGSGIKSYPATGHNINIRVNSLQSLRGSFNATTPSNVSHDLAYDIWLDNHTYEVMIWQKWSGTKPIAGSYDANGNAIPLLTNQSIGGITYNVYKRNNVISFLRTSQVNSASGSDLREVLLFCNRKGYYNNPVVHDVQFGWEIITTNGQKQFTMNSNSLSYR